MTDGIKLLIKQKEIFNTQSGLGSALQVRGRLWAIRNSTVDQRIAVHLIGIDTDKLVQANGLGAHKLNEHGLTMEDLVSNLQVT